MNIRNAFVALALFPSCVAAIAADTTDPKVLDAVVKNLLGTLFVVPHTESVDGKMSGCGLEYSVLARDFSTQGGAPVKLVGSYYLRALGSDGLGYVLKLGLIDGLGSESRSTAPANAFVRAPRGKAPVAKPIRTGSDTPGFALFIGRLDLDTTPTLEAIYGQKKFVLGFNRKLGQTDVLTTVDLRVTDTKIVGNEVKRTLSDDSVDEFTYCVGELIKQVKDK